MLTQIEYDKSRAAILWCEERGVITTMECNAQIHELEQRETKRDLIDEDNDNGTV